VREVRVVIETGKKLRIFTNNLTASATEIAALYKRRWAIELFFRWVKQTLKIGHFLGTSENAVRIQIAVALIAFVLLRLAHDVLSSRHRPQPAGLSRVHALQQFRGLRGDGREDLLAQPAMRGIVLHAGMPQHLQVELAEIERRREQVERALEAAQEAARQVHRQSLLARISGASA
jgi:hypothetical protein